MRTSSILKIAVKNRIFHSEISVGNFGLPFKTFHFLENVPVSGAKLVLPFTF